MQGDDAIIVTAEVSQQERLRRTQDNPRFGVGPPALVLRHRASAVVETAGKPQDCRDADCSWLLAVPIDVALNPAAGLSHSAARPTGPWAGISLRAPGSDRVRDDQGLEYSKRAIADIRQVAIYLLDPVIPSSPKKIAAGIQEVGTLVAGIKCK